MMPVQSQCYLLLIIVLALGDSAILAAPAEVVRPELATSLDSVLPLEAGWRNPPTESQVQCWWWWLNGNVTKQAITRDLEAMRDKGIGGANIIDAAHASQSENSAPPHGPDFASPEWKALFVHALREADRLELELGLNIQSGWNLGGPTVAPAQAAKKLTFLEVIIQGGSRVQRALPQPDHSYDCYHDVRLLALPLPADGAPLARVDNFRQKAYDTYPGGFTAVDASHLLKPGKAQPGEHVVAPGEVLDLTDHLRNGKLVWDAPPGRWLVLRFGYSVSGARVSTSSENWKGLAIDYLDPAAFEKYCDDVLTPILDAAGPLVGKSLRNLHTDSWELGPVNWTPAMPKRFQSLRGYDMTPYMPALAGYAVGGHVTATQFLNDFRRTIADLIADGKYAAFSKYAHDRGLGIHPESGGPHAAPVDALLCLGRSDIPMGEFWARSRTHRTADTSRLFVKQPASAAHVYGRRFVMAEAFTTIGPHWERDPCNLKPVFDRVACEGLNRVMWHTFDCSPAEQGLPGQAYFAGTHLNPNVTWWGQSEGFLGYLNRCQFLLQQGVPVSDVLYYYGENVPSFVRLKHDDPAGVQPDYDYDVINCEALCQRSTVTDGRVTLPDGASYAALVLPPPGHYGLAALKQIAELADAGALVIGRKPANPIGLYADASQKTDFLGLADRLWGQELVVSNAARDELRKHGVQPDFSYSSRKGVRLDYIHRHTADAEIYFVVNRRDASVVAPCSFRVADLRPELWDPVSGTVSAGAIDRQEEGRSQVTLRLPPNGSVFVIFRDPADSNPYPISYSGPDRIVAGEEISGPYRVTFDPDSGGPGEVVFDALRDWSMSDDDRVRYYSGTATYECEFTLPESTPEGMPRWLDLGEVKNMARVYVNDIDLGVVWTPPFRVDIREAADPGENQLRIEVVNLWPNRLIGDARLPKDQRITNTNIRKFRANSPLLPSGLLGPVRLMFESQP